MLAAEPAPVAPAPRPRATATPAAPTPAAVRNPIGAHAPVARGLATAALGYADRTGCEAVQVFVANPRGWATGPGNPAQDEEFRAGCAERGISAWVHAPYLINFGSSTAETVRRSAVSLRHSLLRGAEIGARGVVVHTGSATGGLDRATAYRQVRDGVLPLLEELDALAERGGAGDGPAGPGGAAATVPWLLLEPMAGQGSTLCSLMEDLGPYLEALDHHPRVGVCLDTCHAFAAGHDLAAPDGVRRTLDELLRVAGPGRLRLIHANDSKDVAGAHRDRHENVGSGRIGAEPFAALFDHPATAGVPLVVETPGGEEGHASDVAALKRLRGDAVG
ncbi:deoxyribonuclease IV [Allostreptomyces psammosilenae]|uniref:Probable endonuclease 4 n=1 Tax=Allostreptomyces psammosilenae TaxID=1892865 RepID=A0A853A955_9ACTN|nr:deoxyribonuclease IV [Allostreptomyces psammosilenae]NYI07058.1 deoxyribonuclease-4 [Allostreptomyces psammosilenae]